MSATEHNPEDLGRNPEPQAPITPRMLFTVPSPGALELAQPPTPAPAPSAHPCRTGLIWALGLSNPLVRLEWTGWRRRPWRRGFFILLAIALVGFMFFARYGVKGDPGYLAALSNWMRGFTLQSAASAASSTPVRSFLVGIAVNFEAALMRLTTLFPWALVLFTVWRVRRSGHWDLMRLTALTPRDWIAGLAGPPIVISTVALAIFLPGVVYPSFRLRYEIGTPVYVGSVGSIPTIAIEGFANLALVAGFTLREGVRTHRFSLVVRRSITWVVILCLLQAALLVPLNMWLPMRSLDSWTRTLAGRMGVNPLNAVMILWRTLPLLILGIVKLAFAYWFFRWLGRTFWDRLALEADHRAA